MTETQGSATTRTGRPPSDILDRIVATKRLECRELVGSASDLWARARAAPPTLDFESALSKGSTVTLVAEVKRRSPGAGAIRPDLDPVSLASRYAEAGAGALSVLTDRTYFGGSLADLEAIREAVDIPILRKDFMLEPVQVAEARASGADAVLLIVRVLDDGALRELSDAAHDLGMAALVEVHDEAELERAEALGATVVGINNRNLTTFTTDLTTTLGLMGRVPRDVVVVSESGIRAAEEVDRLGAAGVHAVLVGESLLRADDPGRIVTELAGRPRLAPPG